jgi:hypothetical protein
MDGAMDMVKYVAHTLAKAGERQATSHAQAMHYQQAAHQARENLMTLRLEMALSTKHSSKNSSTNHTSVVGGRN